MAAAFCDKLMAYDVAPEEWRKLDVRVGEPAAGDFCDNSIKTYKYNPISWLPKSLFEQMRRLANQFFLVMGILMAIGTFKPELFVSPQGPGGDDLRHGLPGAARRAGQRPGPGGGSL